MEIGKFIHNTIPTSSVNNHSSSLPTNRTYSEPPSYPGTRTATNTPTVGYPSHNMSKFVQQQQPQQQQPQPQSQPQQQQQRKSPYVPLGEIRRNVATAVQYPGFNPSWTPPSQVKEDEVDYQPGEEELLSMSSSALVKMVLDSRGKLAAQTSELKSMYYFYYLLDNFVVHSIYTFYHL